MRESAMRRFARSRMKWALELLRRLDERCTTVIYWSRRITESQQWPSRKSRRRQRNWAKLLSLCQLQRACLIREIWRWNLNKKSQNQSRTSTRHIERTMRARTKWASQDPMATFLYRLWKSLAFRKLPRRIEVERLWRWRCSRMSLLTRNLRQHSASPPQHLPLLSHNPLALPHPTCTLARYHVDCSGTKYKKCLIVTKAKLQNRQPHYMDSYFSETCISELKRQ